MFGNKDRMDDSPTYTPPTSSSRSSNSSSDAITAYLGPDIAIEGTLKFESSVLIEGNFQGKIISETGSLVIGEKANVKADITAGTITVRGKLKGSVTANQRVHLQDRGSFNGELTTPSLQMDESVTFEGSCTMPKPGQSSPHKPKYENKSSEDKILEAVDSVR